jgi:ATP-dependent DNA helicase DinG
VSGIPALPEPDQLTAAVAALFAPEGVLARSLPGYEVRPSQQSMATAVARVLVEGGTLLAEAGTGTGKTIAYLAPAILSGRRTLVSTGTRNLQDQIVQKDLPLLSRVLGRPFRATCMKGRANYLCVHRLEQLRHAPPRRGSVDRVHFALIDDWARGTATGDRAEIEDLPDASAVWNDLSATTEHCLGSTCEHYDACFVTRMRQRAAESDLVVVNHHLLCADWSVRAHSFGEVVPECEAAVVDEAHQLEDVATQYFGIGVSQHRLADLVRDVERVLASGSVAVGRARAALRVAAARAVETTGALVEAVDAAIEARARTAGGAAEERLRLGPETREAVGEAGLAVAAALDDLEAATALVKGAPDDVLGVGSRAARLAADLRFVLAASDPSFVYYLERRGRSVCLRATPVDVSGIVREMLYDRMRATVLTSATLAVGDSFAYTRGRLGIHCGQSLRLPSEFDYARQSILYLPRGMPDPRTPEFGPRAADEVAEILARTEGRAFVLFTSYAMLRVVQARVAAALPYPLLVQGGAPRTVLLDQFRATPNAVLLATSSFWQGVDVVGEALSCVVIDKLPFASPADPVVQARIEAITEQGGDAFGSYQVPLAILTLLQGLGRLLRHRTDRGVLAILDPRVRTMAYGRRFLEALPPAPITDDPADIDQFFAT